MGHYETYGNIMNLFSTGKPENSDIENRAIKGKPDLEANTQILYQSISE